jgi:hypothetical protein
MIRMNNARGVGALGAMPPLPPCLTDAPGDYKVRQKHFNPGGRYEPGTPGFDWYQQQMALIRAHLANCGDGEERLTLEMQYNFALVMLVDLRGALEALEDDCDADLRETEDYLVAAEDAAEACQAALAAGQGCPPPPACPPPVVAQRRQQRLQQRQPQQQGSKWGTNLGWIAGSAVAGAALTFFLVKR